MSKERNGFSRLFLLVIVGFFVSVIVIGSISPSKISDPPQVQTLEPPKEAIAREDRSPVESAERRVATNPETSKPTKPAIPKVEIPKPEIPKLEEKFVLEKIDTMPDVIQGKVLKARGGDTFSVNADGRVFRVSLYAADAPELSQAYGSEAEEFLARLEGEVVKVEIKGRDNEDRVIGHVTFGGRSIAEHLIRKGFAWYDDRYAEVEAFAEAQSMAQQEQLGVWKNANPIPPWEFRVHLKAKAEAEAIAKAEKKRQARLAEKKKAKEALKNRWPASESMALIMAQDFVKKQLKAPSTAKWPGIFGSGGHSRSIGSDRYVIRSWVDSQNSFGAMIRSKYTCTVKQTGESTWTLESFSFHE